MQYIMIRRMPDEACAFASVTFANGMPVMTTARPARSEKSRPSLTLPLQQSLRDAELAS